MIENVFTSNFPIFFVWKKYVIKRKAFSLNQPASNCTTYMRAKKPLLTGSFNRKTRCTAGMQHSDSTISTAFPSIQVHSDLLKQMFLI
jgi:hypothetical protein